MSTPDLIARFDGVERDLTIVEGSPNFIRIRNMSALNDPWSSAKALATKWMAKAGPVKTLLDDSSLQPLVGFAERIVAIGDGKDLSGLSIPDAIQNATSNFLPSLPLLIYGLLEAAGI